MKRQVTESIQCESFMMGVYPHPMDCSKFIQCDRGRTYIVDCAVNTVFNDLAKVCDWPWKTSCGARPFYGNIAVQPSSLPPPPTPFIPTYDPQTNNYPQEEIFHGEGLINVRTGRLASQSQQQLQPTRWTPQTYSSNMQNMPHQHQHQQYQQPYHNHHNHQHQPQPQSQRQYHPQPQHQHQHQSQNPWQASSNRGQTWNQVPTEPNPNPNRIVFMYPDQPTRKPVNPPPSQSNHYTSNDLSNRVLAPNKPRVQPTNAQNRYPEVKLMSNRVGSEFLKYFSVPKPNQKPSAKAVETPIILKVTPQQFLDTNLLSGRVGNQFNEYFVNPTPKSDVNLRFSPKTEIHSKQKPAEIDYITLVQQGTASHQYPQINLMSPMVGNEFYRYFAYPKPKSTENPSATNEIHENRNEVGGSSPGKDLFHGEPHLNRKIVSPLHNYNRLYYKSARKSYNQAERNDEPNNGLVSDNLKELLKQVVEKSSNKNNNLTPKVSVDSRIPSKEDDVETFQMTSDHKHIQNAYPQRTTTVGTTLRPYYHRTDGNYDPNIIYFPGPHTQSHSIQHIAI